MTPLLWLSLISVEFSLNTLLNCWDPVQETNPIYSLFLCKVRHIIPKPMDFMYCRSAWFSTGWGCKYLKALTANPHLQVMRGSERGSLTQVRSWAKRTSGTTPVDAVLALVPEPLLLINVQFTFLSQQVSLAQGTLRSRDNCNRQIKRPSQPH